MSDNPGAITGNGYSQEQLMALLNSTVDAIISIDDQHCMTLFNSGAEALFGFRSDETIGQPLDMLIPDRFRATHADHIHSFAASAKTARLMGERREIFGKRRSGEEFSAEASISKMNVDGKSRFVVVLRDITQRKAIEFALRESENRLKLAVEAGRIGLFEHQHETGDWYFSPIFREIWGLAAAEPATMATALALVPPEDRDALLASYREAYELGGSGRFTSEHRILRREAELRWVAVNALTLFDGEGAERRAIRTIGAVRDTTERRQREQDLETRIREHTEALRQEIKQRETAQAALVQAQRMDALGQLTGGIAHDSNNLLTVIAGNLEMIEDELPGGHAAGKYLREAQEAARMGASLNQRLLTFSRRRKLEPRVINLNDGVLAMAELLRRAMGETVTLTTVLKPDVWPTLVDPGEIENAVLNLAINARDAMPAGGEVRVETSNVTLSSDVATGQFQLKDCDYVKLTVSDTGTGMPPDVVARAFEPFFTTKGPAKGTGLGLSTIYGFVKQSGGHVTIDSEVGKGTTVTVLLPRAIGQDGRRSGLADGLAPAQAQGEIVLVVEDNAQVRRLTVERLRRLGYHPLEAESGPSALAILDLGNRIDLIFSDVVMPGGLSGYDLATLVRQRLPSQRMLLTSGYTFDNDGQDQKRHPDLRILRKPYSLADLAKTLREVLDA